MVARWKPVHLGHAAVLRGLCGRAGQALIGIGSSNRYSLRNPPTLDETTEMIRRVLGDRGNYSLVPVPDLDDGQRWRELVLRLFGPLDLFVTANAYVAHLLEVDYRIARPVDLIADEERVAIDGTAMRREMARGDGWRELVPEAVARYIVGGRLDERFRREFGLATLALEAPALEAPP